MTSCAADQEEKHARQSTGGCANTRRSLRCVISSGSNERRGLQARGRRRERQAAVSLQANRIDLSRARMPKSQQLHKKSKQENHQWSNLLVVTVHRDQFDACAIDRLVNRTSGAPLIQQAGCPCGRRRGVGVQEAAASAAGAVRRHGRARGGEL